MPRYNVDVPFWRHGELLPVDSEVTMTIGEAKYLGHAITEKKAPTEKTVAPEPAPAEPEVEQPALATEVVEHLPVPVHHRRRRNNAE